MIIKAGFIAAACLAMAGCAASYTEEVRGAHWDRPAVTPADKRYYPSTAVLLDKPGFVILSCRMLDDRSVTDCKVAFSAVKDMGFEAAALRMSADARIDAQEAETVRRNAAILGKSENRLNLPVVFCVGEAMCEVVGKQVRETVKTLQAQEQALVAKVAPASQ